jgi:hypothetical protein
MYGDAHGVAYVLDPRYLGDRMSRTLRKEIEDFIFNFPQADRSTSKRGKISWRKNTRLSESMLSMKGKKKRIVSR